MNRPGSGALAATRCSHWIDYLLKEDATDLQRGQPAKRKAISTAQRKHDSLAARTLADLLRCHLFPAAYALPAEYEALRRQLRQRARLVRMRVLWKNPIAGLLIQSRISYKTPGLHRQGYLSALLATDENLAAELKQLLLLNRQPIDRPEALDKSLVAQLKQDPLLAGRLEQVGTLRGVGEMTALTGALEAGFPQSAPAACLEAGEAPKLKLLNAAVAERFSP